MSVILFWHKIGSWTKELVRKLSDKDYRHAYLAESIRTGIAFQIRALREQSDRNWSQADLGERMGKPQSAISRLENPEYGKVTIQTLLETAQAFDVALLVQFVEWDDWLSRVEDISPTGLQKKGFDEGRLMSMASRQISFSSYKMPMVPHGALHGEMKIRNINVSQRVWESKFDAGRFAAGKFDSPILIGSQERTEKFNFSQLSDIVALDEAGHA